MVEFGYDPGFGNTKVASQLGGFSIQTAVSVPKDVGMSATGMKLAKAGTRVEFADYQFMVGEGSWRWGQPITGLDWTSLVTPERMALLYSLLPSVLGMNEDGEQVAAQMVIGLPVPLLLEEESAKEITKQLRQMKGEHRFSVDGQSFGVTIDRIRMLAQPVGAYYDYMFDDELNLMHDPSERIAVVDVGQNTVDIYSMQDGQVDPRFIGGSKSGARRVLLRINPGAEIEETTFLVSNRKKVLDKSVTASWLSEVMNDVETNLGNLARFDRVILTGGGVELIRKELAETITNRGAKVFVPHDTVLSNAVGFYKWAAKQSGG